MSHARDNARLARTGIPTVDTAQDLRDLAVFSEEEPSSVQTFGALTVDDGGAGLWRWDSASVAADDLGTVLLPADRTDPGRWLRVIDSPYHVDWFGASAGGDVVLPIQSAIDVAGQEPLVFGVREYTVTDKLTFRGDGDYRGSMLLEEHYSTVANIPYIKLYSTYTGTDPSFQIGRDIDEAEYGGIMRGLTMIRDNMGGPSVGMRAVHRFTLTNCKMRGGTEVLSLSGSNHGCWENRIVNCSMTDIRNTSTAIGIHLTKQPESVASNNENWFTRCYISDVGQAAQIENGSRAVFEMCEFARAVVQGIVVEDSHTNATFLNCRMEQNNLPTDVGTHVLQTAGPYTTIIACNIASTTLSSLEYLLIDPSVEATCAAINNYGIPQDILAASLNIKSKTGLTMKAMDEDVQYQLHIDVDGNLRIAKDDNTTWLRFEEEGIFFNTRSVPYALRFVNASGTPRSQIIYSDASPEGLIAARVGSICLCNDDPGLFVKESGTGDTGWIKK